MEEKSNDDEIPNYITELNTVRAKQEIASNSEVLTRIAFTSQSKTFPLNANHKKDHSYSSHQLQQSKYYLKILMEEK